MGIRRHRAKGALAVLLTVAAIALPGPAQAENWADCPIETGTPSTPQQPGCSIQDVGNALQDTYNGFVNGQCGAACSDPVTCGLAVFLMTLVGGMGQQSQSFCNTVNDVSNWTNNSQQDITNATDWLNKIDPSLGSQFEGYLQSVSGALSGGAALESSFTCACSITSGLGQVFGSVGSCVQAGICQAANWAHDIAPWINSCTGTITTVWANCTQPACPANGPCTDPGVVLICPSPGSDGFPIVCNSDQTVCFQPDGADANGNGTMVACFCPPPMHLTQVSDPRISQYPYLQCICPQGTSPAAASGPLANTCICDLTHLPAEPPGSQNGMCPTPLTGIPCPNGQVNLGGKCITPCSNPTQVLLANGSCCDPSMAAACGECCAPGQAPDPKTGACARSFTPVKGPPPRAVRP
jgi:hypothetical protein